jgi:diaminohydroxyphosphoribosylaminopyrimidine deaminase/5-amino-6-(5-phosphoribosylamino)uracil reductase
MKTKNWTKSDIVFMEKAFEQAHIARRFSRPNPAVGAVIVKRGRIIASGHTHSPGGIHAEIHALKKAGRESSGSTLYVTLEPCCHFGKTPPCVDSIISHGVKKVIVSMIDPNSLVKGKGILSLEKAGILVKSGLLEQNAKEFYEFYSFFIKNKRPAVILKIAQSLDGSINSAPGIAAAITGKNLKKWVHTLRNRVDAVIIGANTYRIDNPDLSPRLVTGERKQDPDAVILTRKGRLPVSHRLFKKGRRGKCVVISENQRNLPPWIDLQVLPHNMHGIKGILKILIKKGYHAVLVEGGVDILTQWICSRLWDRFYILSSAKILPKGQKWSIEMPVNWQKSVKFGKFWPVGNDFLLEVLPNNSLRR